MLTTADPWLVHQSFRACPCQSNRRALVESIACNWLPATAGKFVRSVGHGGPDRLDEFVAASYAAVVKSLDRLLAKEYAESLHLRADIRQIATRAMSETLDNERPSGIGPSSEARRKRRERGTVVDRPSDPKRINIDALAGTAGEPSTMTGPLAEIAAREREEFLDWFAEEADRQCWEWVVWEAITLIQCQPAFGVGREKHVNVAALARFLRVKGDHAEPEVLARRLARKLYKLGCLVARACTKPEHHENGREILKNVWIRATESRPCPEGIDSEEAA